MYFYEWILNTTILYDQAFKINEYCQTNESGAYRKLVLVVTLLNLYQNNL